MKTLGLLAAFLLIIPVVHGQLNPPQNLIAEYQSESEVELRWSAPGGQVQPYNYWLYRNNEHVDIIEGTGVTVVLPEYGTFFYNVRAFYDGGLSVPSNEVMLVWFSEDETSFLETFDTGLPASWTIEPANSTNTWTWTEEPFDGVFETPHIVTAGPIWFIPDYQRITTIELDFSDIIAVHLSFDHYMRESSWRSEIGRVQYTLNGSSWFTIATYANQNIDLEHVTFNLSDELVGESTVMFRFEYEVEPYPWFSAYEWRIDNVSVLADAGNELPIVLDLLPRVVDIPASGGPMYYDARLINTLDQQILGADYMTFVELPNGNTIGPLSVIPVRIWPFMDQRISALGLIVPESATPGTYEFIGQVGVNASMYVEDTFEFTKAGNTVDGASTAGAVSWETLGTWPDELAEFESGQSSIPDESGLSPAYPNPFNSNARITLSLAESVVSSKVAVYNIEGREVLTLAEGSLQAGRHTFSVNASDLASGVYFVRATASNGLNITRKLVLIR